MMKKWLGVEGTLLEHIRLSRREQWYPGFGSMMLPRPSTRASYPQDVTRQTSPLVVCSNTYSTELQLGSSIPSSPIVHQLLVAAFALHTISVTTPARSPSRQLSTPVDPYNPMTVGSPSC